MAKKVIVGGRIESKEVGGIVTGAAEILDDTKGKKQNVINQETDAELERLDGAKQDVLTFDNTPTEGSNNPVKSGGVYAADKALSDAIEAILLLIPSAASALNKLVDQATMNSSISTATATFRGTYNVITDLELTVDATHEQIAAKLAQVVSEADNNDYAFVQVPVSAESTDIRRTERYKFNGTAWAYEYDLNTSGFTAAQWAAINSGITLALVGKLIGLPTSSELQTLLGQKQNTLTFDNIPTSGSNNPVKSGGVYSAINDEKTAREQLAQSVTGINGRLGNVEEVIPSGAAANNKLVANSSMEAYVTSIIEAITASFTIATADGHINLTLTQTNGQIASLTLTSSDIASAQALTALTGRVSTAESDITTLSGRVSTNETDIANLQQLYNDLQQSKPEPVTALPETGQQQGVIYRLAGTTSYSDYMWNGSTWVLMATYNNAIDPRPKKASQNLVTSGGVFDNMGALDVSELNATENPHTLAQYVDLSAALAAIPTDYQKGGMSIKFVQSSDNKYVQYRLMPDTFSTTVSDWQGVDDVPTAGSDNMVKSGGVYDNITLSLPNVLNRIHLKKGKAFDINNQGSIKDNSLISLLFKYEIPTGVDGMTVLNKVKSGGQEYVLVDIACFYDENGTYLSSIGGSDKPIGLINIDFPKTAKYFSLNIANSSIKDSQENVLLSFYTKKEHTTGYKYKLHKNVAIGSSGVLGANDLCSVVELCVKNRHDLNIYALNAVTAAGVLYPLNILAAFYDANNELIGSIIEGTVTINTYQILRVPNGAVTLKINIDNIAYADGVQCFFISLSNDVDFVSKWKSKKAIFIGDSITAGNGTDTSYPEILNNYLEFGEYINYGVGGRYLGGEGESFLTQYSNYDNDADLVVVMGGTNDFLFEHEPLGQLGDTTNATFYGSLYLLMTGLLQKYPSATVIFMTPLHYHDTGKIYRPDSVMDDWAEAVIKSGKRCGLPVIDFRNITGMNPNIAAIRTAYFSDQWVHPNRAGIEKYISRIYKNFELY